LHAVYDRRSAGASRDVPGVDGDQCLARHYGADRRLIGDVKGSCTSVMARSKDKPVRFLDIDGVLISAEFIQQGGTSDTFDPQAVAELQRVVDETGCVIVLSSSW